MPRARPEITGLYADSVVQTLRERLAEVGGPKALSAQIGIDRGLLSRVAAGKRPPPASVIKALGFELPVMAAVPAGYGVGPAFDCGHMPHASGRCPVCHPRKPTARRVIKRAGSVRRGIRFGHGEGRQGDQI
jgi:hypothetical protein